MQRPVCSMILPPGSCFPPAFQAHPQETPPQSREWSLCMLWGACYCAACFKAAGIPVHRKTSLCVPLDASWVSLKKVPTQVFSYKQKTTEEQLLWSSIIYTGWRWLLEIDFPPSYRVYKFFCFFRFPVRCSALYIVLIKHLLDESLYFKGISPQLLSFVFLNDGFALLSDWCHESCVC